MPLIPGKTDAAVSANITELERSGRSHRQSVAIALSQAGRNRKNGVSKIRVKPKRKS